jgi:hypothetical protein
MIMREIGIVPHLLAAQGKKIARDEFLSS